MTVDEQAVTNGQTIEERWRGELASLAHWLSSQAERIDPAAPTANGELQVLLWKAHRRLEWLWEPVRNGAVFGAGGNRLLTPPPAPPANPWED